MAEPKPPPAATNRQTQRILRDLQYVKDNPLPFVQNLEISVVDGLHQLTGILVGPENSTYAGQNFNFLIQFPPEFPFKPPDFIFREPISHPNVDEKTGTACHDQLLATWAPNVTLSKLLSEIHSLLAHPNYDTPINGGASTAGNQ